MKTCHEYSLPLCALTCTCEQVQVGGFFCVQPLTSRVSKVNPVQFAINNKPPSPIALRVGV